MRKILLVFLILALILALTSCAQLQIDTNSLKVHFIDVGQADSIFVQLPGGRTMLIDAGNNKNGKGVVDYIKKQNVTKLDFLIGTHPDADHIGGIDNVIESFVIGNFYMPKVTHNTETFKDVLEAASEKGIKINSAREGIELLAEEDLSMKILAPNSDKYKDTNNYSAVIKLIYGSTSFLFTGDAEKESENEMLAKELDLKADVLKIGHHGSSSSTTLAFLEKVAPKYAIISCGKDNAYSHPHKDTVEHLNEKSIGIYRTDELGTIIATSDGKTINFDK